MRYKLLPFVAVLALAACDVNGSDSAEKPAPAAPTSSVNSSGADSMASRDGETGQVDQIPDPVERLVMEAQVRLDRLGFTPGVVDGEMGMSTINAIRGFQRANDLEETGSLDEATKTALNQGQTIPATRIVTIPEDFAAGPFYKVPEDAEDQAKLEKLGYESLDEKLAERFHTTIATLKKLNPNGLPAGMKAPASKDPSESPKPEKQASSDADKSKAEDAKTKSTDPDAFTPQPGPESFFKAGQQIRVPNVGADRIVDASGVEGDWLSTLKTLGVGTEQPKVAKIVVSKSKGTLSAYDASDKLVALFTATMGSEHDPLPLGNWKILGVAHNPPFSYNPELFWDVSDKKDKLQLPPGPNGPVGVAWIDLSKEHYGIHGTGEPQSIGRAQSHGCVRLTNWDVARLSQMVSSGTKVVFEK